MRFSTVVCRMRCWCSVPNSIHHGDMCVHIYKKNPLHMWFFFFVTKFPSSISTFFCLFFLSYSAAVVCGFDTPQIPQWWWKHQIWSFTVCFYLPLKQARRHHPCFSLHFTITACENEWICLFWVLFISHVPECAKQPLTQLQLNSV